MLAFKFSDGRIPGGTQVPDVYPLPNGRIKKKGLVPNFGGSQLLSEQKKGRGGGQLQSKIVKPVCCHFIL